MIVEKVNPLVEWSDTYLLKLNLKTYQWINDSSAILTGDPKKLDGGSVALWERK